MAVRAETGEKVWVKRGAGVLSSPAVADGIVYVHSCDCRLYALRAATGQELWQVHTARPTITAAGNECTPAVNGGVVYVEGYDGDLFALDAQTGKPLWKTTKHASAQALAIADGVLYLGTYRFGCDAGPASTMSCPLLAIEAKTGNTRWQVTDQGGFYAAPVVADCLP